ncbi:MAG TPA: ATP-binding protein [Gemmatimonadaceae bacterium]|nr:ATP-binding protein [Gemmatimonadaceae bacterium]
MTRPEHDPVPAARASMLLARDVDQTPADVDPSVGFARRYLEHAPAASAVVSGAAHALVFANAAFRHLSEDAAAHAEVGVPIGDTLPSGAREGVVALLDRVRRDGIAVRDARAGPMSGRGGPPIRAAWRSDVWPIVAEEGRLDYLAVTLRATRRGEDTRAHQRAITERLLLTALREQERARRADQSSARAAFLAEASLRLGASFEQETAYATVAAVALPTAGAWSIVDVAQPSGSWRRLTIVHPDPTKQDVIHELAGHWSPAPGDPIGAPRIEDVPRATIVVEEPDAILAVAAHGSANFRLLGALELGPLLVVPLIAHGRLRGAITFVAPRGAGPYTADDVLLAEDLAGRCADVLDGARLYNDARLAQIEAATAREVADAARRDAERANQVKTTFLTSMSHELRTPLNAILGYTELVSIGLRGPVSAGQEDALGRIRRAATHLLGLINDVLNFAKLKALQVQYLLADVPVSELLDSAESMIEPQALVKGVGFTCTPCPRTLAVHGDREKVLQILLNLLSNAVKFTDAGGQVTLAAAPFDRRWRTAAGTKVLRAVSGRRVQFTVSDTGRGIAAEQLRMIFEPFVQVGQRLLGTEDGTGLGLAISRNLARGMGGDLVVESTLGVGSMFTLTMPCAAS